MNYTERAHKIIDRINQLASITEQPNVITRTFGTNEFMQGAKLVQSWMSEAGLDTYIDNIGNVRGGLVTDPNAPTLIIGSHIDTIVNAGKYDGPLGVIMGLDIIQNIADNNVHLPYNIQLIAFSDEEGVRFHTTYLGSKVVAGIFDFDLLTKTDTSGTTLGEVIKSMDGNPDILSHDKVSNTLLGYFEMHIEQGPVLYESNNPVAVVTAIAGQKRIELIFTGIAGHAGTVPMDMRHDALCCAADCIISIEQFAVTHKHEIVATVGKLNIDNAASNVIPGKVTCSLDLRSADTERLNYAAIALQNMLNEICEDRNIQFEWNPVQEAEPVKCDEKLTRNLKAAIEHSGYESVQLVSGAGHDAVPMSAICGVTMMFIRCYKGISHNPLENVELNDIAAALKVADNFLLKLAE